MPPDLLIEPIRPSVSSSARVPDTTIGSRANQEVFAQASQSINDLGRQYQTTKDDNALISYKKQITDLDDQMAFETDPKKIISGYQDGQNKIYAGIAKQYPELSEAGRKAIEGSMLTDLREHTVRAANQLREQALRDEADYADNMALLSAKSKSKEEQEALLKQGMDHYDQSVKNGLYSQSHADLLKTKLIKDTRETEAGILAHDHPDEFFKHSAEELGISQEKYHTLTNEAVNQDTAAELEMKRKLKQDRDQAIATLNPQNAEHYYQMGWVTKGEASLQLGYPPLTLEEEKSEANDNVSADAMGHIFAASSEEEVKQAVLDAVHKGAKGSAKTQITIMAGIQTDRIKSGLKSTIDDQLNAVRTAIENPDTGDDQYYSQGDDHDTDRRNMNAKALRDLKTLTDASKTPEDVVKAGHLVLDRVTKFYADKHKAAAVVPAPAPTGDTRSD